MYSDIDYLFEEITEIKIGERLIPVPSITVLTYCKLWKREIDLMRAPNISDLRVLIKTIDPVLSEETINQMTVSQIKAVKQFLNQYIVNSYSIFPKDKEEKEVVKQSEDKLEMGYSLAKVCRFYGQPLNEVLNMKLRLFLSLCKNLRRIEAEENYQLAKIIFLPYQNQDSINRTLMELKRDAHFKEPIVFEKTKFRRLKEELDSGEFRKVRGK